ncbi:MAG: DUF2721 domain-containing protein [Gemmatimonadota bacterium]
MIPNARDGFELIASMATPAVLLLGNAMLILSTNQRLQSILKRLRELEERLERGELSDPDGSGLDRGRFRSLAARHRRRARFAHRALLALYLSGGLFILVVLLIGAAGLGAEGSGLLAIGAALIGCVLLLAGIAQLAAETWLGISATDEQFRALSE